MRLDTNKLAFDVHIFRNIFIPKIVNFNLDKVKTIFFKLIFLFFIFIFCKRQRVFKFPQNASKNDFNFEAQVTSS